MVIFLEPYCTCDGHIVVEFDVEVYFRLLFREFHLSAEVVVVAAACHYAVSLAKLYVAHHGIVGTGFVSADGDTACTFTQYHFCVGERGLSHDVGHDTLHDTGGDVFTESHHGETILDELHLGFSYRVGTES